MEKDKLFAFLNQRIVSHAIVHMDRMETRNQQRLAAKFFPNNSKAQKRLLLDHQRQTRINMVKK